MTKRYNDITIEVVAVTEKNAWAEMRHFVVSMEKLLLKNYPGLSKVNRYVVRVIDQLHETDHEVNCLLDNDDVESRLREKAPWLPLDFDWFRQRVWRNPEKLETLNMHHRLEVLKRLLITSEKRRFPATWTISYPEKGSPIELRLHSDVTGKCFHKPLLIPVDNFLKRHSGVLKIGITLLSVASSAIPVPVIGAAVGQALTESRNALEQASATKSIVDKAQLNPGEKKWHNELRMTPEASMAFLRDLLKIHNPQHDEFTIGEACNLRCAVTKDGRFVWVNALEMEKMKDHLDPCEPESMPPIKPILPINPKPSPSSLKSVSFAITSMAWSSDAGGLSIFAKAYCEWEIVHSSSSQIIREGKTERFKRTNADVLLKVSPEPLDFVTSIEMLHNCTVKVYLKHGRRLTGSIRGQELLDDHINTDCRTSQTVRIPISVNSGKQSHTVACELDIKFST